MNQNYPQKSVMQSQPQIMDDDDEDLRIFTNDLNRNDSIFGNQQMDKLYEDVTRHIHFLKYADLSKRVDSLVSINEMIVNLTEANQPVLMKAANELVGAFVHVMNDTFDK